MSHEDNIADQFGYLMITSDPVISELIEKQYNKPQRRRARAQGLIYPRSLETMKSAVLMEMIRMTNTMLLRGTYA